ncbi:MAG TPA: response regulator [Pseudobdellovibrionaceae bacterium]|nr:response regulator [Pseudobdellovibrionaceae bacterium]
MSDLIKVLIIDDEKSIRETLKLSFKSDVYLVEEAATGAMGLDKIKSFHPHLVILDLGLPDINGFDVLKEVRRWTQVPILILTVTDDEQTKVRLLDAGADDFLTKPFGSFELLARVRVILRHFGKVEATPLFESGDLKVDLNAHKIEVAGREVKLTKTEFELLQRLVRDAGKVVPQNRLLKEIWGVLAQEESHYLRIYIKQLRKKIEVNPSRPTHIITEPGVGYRLV